MNSESVYWVFSSAAQSISTFIAFLIAGYTLVQNIMDNALKNDDSLEEILVDLRGEYHKKLEFLASTTCIAIISNLMIVFFNDKNYPIPAFVLAVVVIMDVFVMVGGTLFVVEIIDPKKYKIAAKKVLEESGVKTNQFSTKESFFNAFIKLERLIRNYYREELLLKNSINNSLENPSFRKIIELLLKYEVIGYKFYEELIQINKFRNLIFHGEVEDIDEGLVERTLNAIEEFKKLKIEGHTNNFETTNILANSFNSKYSPLYNYLIRIEKKESSIELKFKEIEEILSFPLPKSAYTYREWWANPTSKQDHPYAQSWLKADWKVDTVNFDDKSVRFVRSAFQE